MYMKYVNHTHEAAECIQKCSNSNEEFRKLVTAVVKSAISVHNYTSLSICQIQVIWVGIDIHLYIWVFIKPLICQHNQKFSLHLFSFNILLKEYVDLFLLCNCMSKGTTYLYLYCIVDDGWARLTVILTFFSPSFSSEIDFGRPAFPSR